MDTFKKFTLSIVAVIIGAFIVEFIKTKVVKQP